MSAAIALKKERKNILNSNFSNNSNAKFVSRNLNPSVKEISSKRRLSQTRAIKNDTDSSSTEHV